jgi:fructokinase
MPRIVILGEVLIDLFAEKGVPLREAKSLRPSPGGAPANVAVALARLKADVGFISRVGADELGAYLTDLVAKEGVDTTHVVADKREPTMLAVVASPSPEVQHFILYNGANGLMRPADMPQAYIQSAQVFIYGSVTLASESRTAAAQAVQWARDAGKQVVFDVNLRPALWPDLEIARQWIEKAVASATVVKLNENELKFLTGTSDPQQGSQKLLERGMQLCCISLGSEGSYFNNGVVQGQVPAFAVKVLDTTGSGDAFVAGLSYGLSNLTMPIKELDEPTLRRMIRFANACGALSATQVGAMSALPTREAVEQFLQSQS